MPSIGTAISGVSAAGSLFGKKSSSGSGKQQAAISQEQKELSNNVYSDYREYLRPFEISQIGAETDLLPLRTSAIEDYINSGIENRDFYESYYRPIEEQFAAASQDGVKDRSQFLTSRAANEIDKQFANQSEQTDRYYDRHGIEDISSGQHAGLKRGSDIAQAGARADAINRTRTEEERRVEDANYARLGQGVASGQGLRRPDQSTILPQANFSNTPGVAGSILTGASSSASGAANADFRTSQANAQDTAGSLYGLGRSLNNIPTVITNASSGGGYYGTTAGGVSLDQAEAGGLFNYAAGGEVDVPAQSPPQGGFVRGPGTGTSDSINGTVTGPDGQTYESHLSDGEYVIPAKVVNYKGVEFFDNIVKKIFNQESMNDNPGLQRGGQAQLSTPSRGMA